MLNLETVYVRGTNDIHTLIIGQDVGDRPFE